MNKLKTFWGKIKSIKHFEIWLAVCVGLVVCVVYFSFFGGGKSKSDNSQNESTQEYSSAVEYTNFLENKLGNVLSKISGVGSVNVIITLESGFSYEYATDTETTITTETVILVSNKPVVMKEIYPTIKGVVVVAKGAENFSVKMNILSAVETVLEIDRTSITILA